MPRRLSATLILGLALAGRAQDLPTKGPPGSVEREAAQLIEGLPDLTAPPAHPNPTAPPTVPQAEARLAAARKKQERWERLQKAGVVSRVESENAGLEVFQADYRCELARLTEARTSLESARINSTNPTDVSQAETEIKDIQQRLTASQTAWHAASLTLAKKNLDRFRLLYKEHLVTHSQVQRLESTIAILENQAQKDPTVALPPTPPPSPVRPFR